MEVNRPAVRSPDPDAGLYPTRGTITENDAEGASNYNGLQAYLTRKQGSPLQERRHWALQGLPHHRTGQRRVPSQAYNLFNTPQFNNPDTNITNGYNLPGTRTYVVGANPAGANNGFGSINGIRLNTERQLELAAHINF